MALYCSFHSGYNTKMNNFIEFLDKQQHRFDVLVKKEVSSFWSKANLIRQTGLSEINQILNYKKEALSTPSAYFFEAKSKKLRPILGFLLLKAFGAQHAHRFEKYLILPEILHSASLIVDDIEDNATLRRNRPCLHKHYGLDTAVNIANALYFLPFFYLNKANISSSLKTKIYGILFFAMNRIHVGQGLDIFWHKNKNLCITPKEYSSMAKLKTSSFFRAEAELAACLAGKTGPLALRGIAFAENIGVAFQIMDDVLDLTINKNEKKSFGKRFAQDIYEGKKTLIIAYALQRSTAKEKKKILDILALHEYKIDYIIELLNIIEKYNSIEDAQKAAHRLVRHSWNIFSNTLRQSQAKSYLQSFCDFICKRRF